jgi:hypothetical protein
VTAELIVMALLAGVLCLILWVSVITVTRPHPKLPRKG